MGRIKDFIRREFVWKSTLLGILWAAAPFWIFVIAALWMYFRPWFRVRPLLLHFAALLFLAARWAARAEGGALISDLPFSAAWLFRFGGGVALALLFALLLGVKDLHVVRREEAIKVLAIALFFFLSLEVFLLAAGPHRMSHFLLFLLLAALGTYFFRGEAGWKGFSLVSTVLLTEIGALLVFLPVASAEKALIFFIAGIGLFELRQEVSAKEIDLRTLLVYFSGIFFFSALVLAFAEWGI